MQVHVRHTRLIATLLALLLCWNGFAHAARPSHRLALLHAALRQQQSPTPSAPPAAETTSPQPPTGIRERLRFAHTLFLNSTGDDQYFPLPQDATYNSLLNALNRWGRYRIVTDVKDADLVLQTHGVVTVTDTPGAPDPTTGAPTSTTSYESSLQLTLADPHTLAPLWVFHLPLQRAFRHKSQERSIAALGENTVSQLKLLAGDPLTRQEQASLKDANKNHAGLGIGILAGSVGLSLGLFFIARHSMKQNAANFCQQHNLSPCPGA